VALYNQAGYLAQLDQLAEAVEAMEEVVAIDERLGLPDLESDRATLATYRRRLAGEPEPPTEAGTEGEQFLAALQHQLAQTPPEAQAELRQFIDHVEQLSPQEQAALARDFARQQLQAQAEQVAQAALSAWQQEQVAELLPHLEQLAANLAAGAVADLAQFVRAVLALLQGQTPEPVAPDFAERLATLEMQLGQALE
jgi:hypothetical protein